MERENWMMAQLGGARMQERCRSCCTPRSSCMAMCFGEEVLRTTRWPSEADEDLRLRCNFKTLMDLTFVRHIDCISSNTRFEIMSKIKHELKWHAVRIVLVECEMAWPGHWRRSQGRTYGFLWIDGTSDFPRCVMR